MASTKLTEGIKAAMVETGRATEKWRVCALYAFGGFSWVD